MIQNTEEKKKQFAEILNFFCKNLQTQFCFVREEYMECNEAAVSAKNALPRDLVVYEAGAMNAEKADALARAEAVLKENRIPLSYWHGFADSGRIEILEEVPARTACAVASAIRLFLYPHADITLGFNCDKYDRLSIDFYWTISDSHPEGYIESCVL